jgi:hypothetical protein
MSTLAEPVPSEPLASPPPPSPAPAAFECSFRPTGGEVLHAQLAGVSGVIVFFGYVFGYGMLSNIAVRVGASPFLALSGSILALVMVPRLICRAFARQLQLYVDANGFTVDGRPASWESLIRARVTGRAYLLTLRSGELVILPRRVLGEGARRLVDDALAARPALVERQQTSPVLVVVLVVVVILFVVTVYNLFMTGGTGRPRHPTKSGNTPTSSLRMPSSTDATGRSSFIDPTI